MVGARDVIADGLRRVAAEEDGAGVADAGVKRVRVRGGDLQMLGRDAVGERRAPRRASARRMIAPKSRQLAPAMSLARQRWRAGGSTAASTARPRSASSVIRIDCAAVSCSAWARRSAAIHSGSLSLSAMTRTSEGPAIDVDADSAEDLPLGGGDIGVAGADDLGDGGDGRCAVGESRDACAPPTR